MNILVYIYVKPFLINLCLLLLLQNVMSSGIELKGNNVIQESSTKCILFIAETYFEEGSIIAIVQSGLKTVTNLNLTKTTYNMILDKLMLTNRWSIMIKRSNIFVLNKAAPIEKVHNYILFMKTESECTAILKMLIQTSSWNPHALFLIYVDGQVQNWENFVTFVLTQFWKYFVINLTISVPENSVRFTRFVTWMPFHAGNCGKQHSQFIEIARCQNSELIPLGSNTNEVDVFPEKIPLDLNRCTVLIITTTCPPFVLSRQFEGPLNGSRGVELNGGIEIKLIKTILEKRNLIPIFNLNDKEKWGEFRQNGSNTGMIGTLTRAEADIAIGTISPRQDLHTTFDFSIQYLQDETTWVIPILEPFPHWLGLIQLFQPYVWYASIMTYIFVCVAVWTLGNTTNGELQTYVHLNKIVFTVGRMMIGNSPPTFPNSTRLQIVIIMWSIFCLNWFSAYTTSLVSMITSTLYSQNFESVEDILESKITIGMSRESIKYFEMEQYASDRVAAEILRRYELCDGASECLDRVASYKNFTTAISRKYYEFVKGDYIDEDGEPKIIALTRNIVSPPIEMIMLKGYPLLKKINTLLLRIIEAGLIDFWTRSLNDEKSAVTAKKTIRTLNKNQPLKFTHLEGAFLLLALGWVLAAKAFVVELIVHKKKSIYEAVRYWKNIEKFSNPENINTQTSDTRLF